MPSFHPFSSLKAKWQKLTNQSNTGIDDYPPIADHLNPDVPEQWRERSIQTPRLTMPNVGFGYVQEPYAAQFQLVWGNEQPPDYEKYITMYCTVPDAKRSIDIKVSLAFNKSFYFDYTEDKRKRIMENLPQKKGDDSNKGVEDTAEQFIQLVLNRFREIVARIKLREKLSQIAYDYLLLGNTFVELCYQDLDFIDTFVNYSVDNDYGDMKRDYIGDNYRNDPKFKGRAWNPMEWYNYHTTGEEEEETETDYDEWRSQSDSPYMSGNTKKVLKAVTRGRLEGIKMLDPRHMRTRTDAYGTNHGFIQLLAWPPVAFDSRQIAHARRSLKSWGTFNKYGQSDIHSTLATQEILWQLESDQRIFSRNASHQSGMLIGGTEMATREDPVSIKRFNEAFSTISTAPPGAKIKLYGDMTYQEWQDPGRIAMVGFKNMEYHNTRRILGLGIPQSVAGGQENVGTQTTAEQAWNITVVDRMNDQYKMGEFILNDIMAIAIEQEVKNDKEFGVEFMQLADKLKIPYGGEVVDDKGNKKFDLEKFEIPLWILPDMIWEPIDKAEDEKRTNTALLEWEKGAIKRSELRGKLGYSFDPEVDGEDGYYDQLVSAGSGDFGMDFNDDLTKSKAKDLEATIIQKNFFKGIYKDLAEV